MQALHVGAGFEAPGAGVLDGPPLGLEVVDDLERLEHQGVPDRQVAGALLEGDAELGAAGRGPDHVEVPGLEGLVVPLQDVGADARAGLRVAVLTRYLPATGLEGTADRPRATEQLQELHLMKGKKMPTAPAGRRAGPHPHTPRWRQWPAFFFLS